MRKSNFLSVQLSVSVVGLTGPDGWPVSTPHLQKLAKEGTLFRNARSATPTYSPSWAALLTGEHPHQGQMPKLVQSLEETRP